jgi:hypothetical protein
MAIVQYGPTVAGIRGTVAGLTFSANGSGGYVRPWAKGANPQSTLQMVTRGRMSLFSAPWLAMTAPQRAAWDYLGDHPPEVDYNTLGVRIYLSGWQWFVRCGQRNLSCGIGIGSTPPTATPPTPPASVTLHLHGQPGDACTAAWPSGTFPFLTSAILTVALHNTVGLLAHPGGQTLVLAKVSPGDTGETITAAMVGRFGFFPAGWKAFGSLYVQWGSGSRSTPATTTTVTL